MRAERLAFAVAALLSFVVYWLTSAPGLGLVDSGELTTVTQSLGIAHPTGYPLYTLLGRLWQMLIPTNPARAMVLFSGTCAALAVSVLSAAAYRLLVQRSPLSTRVAVASAVLLALGFAFSHSVWTSVSFAEVYPLTLLITALLLWIATNVYLGNATGQPELFVLAAYIWGLGFGNHLTILWFFPLAFWIAIHFVQHSPNRPRAALLLVAAFAAGASINLFLPIRSSVEPLLDWSDPQTLPRLIRHLSAWQYRVWMFQGGLGKFVQNFFSYLSSIPHDLGWVLTPLAAIGAVSALMKRNWLLLTLVAAWLIGVAYNLNYSIPDISTYFVAFYAPLFVLAVVGFNALLNSLKSSTARVRQFTAIGAAAIPAAVSLAIVLPDANQGSYTFAADHARAVLATLPDSALVFQANWDIQSPVIYLQDVAGERTDVAMFDLALMQRPWYLKQEQRHHPEIFFGCESKMSDFVKAVAPFESGEQYDATRLEAAYVDMVNCLIERHYRERPVYVRDTRSVGHPGVAAKFANYPGGYFFRIADNPTPEPLLNPDALLSHKTNFDERERFLLRQAGVAAALRGTFSLEEGDTSTARECLRISTRLSPDDPIVTRFVAQMQTGAGAAH